MYSGVSLMKTKKRWTENCKYLLIVNIFTLINTRDAIPLIMTLPFQRKNGSVYSFFSLSIPVTSIQAGAGFLGRRKKSWGRVRGEKERGPLLPAPPLPFACSPCTARLKKQCMLRRLHSKLLEDIFLSNKWRKECLIPMGFEPLIDWNVFSSGVDLDHQVAVKIMVSKISCLLWQVFSKSMMILALYIDSQQEFIWL